MRRVGPVTVSRLTIPGTHGTWPKRVDWSASRTGGYVCITRPTQQFILFWHYPGWVSRV